MACNRLGSITISISCTSMEVESALDSLNQASCTASSASASDPSILWATDFSLGPCS